MKKQKKSKLAAELEVEKEFSRPLGDVAKKARKELKLTQGQVSEETGIDQRTILNIENYRGNPKMESLYTLIRFYGIDPREIFFPGEAKERPIQERLQLLLATCSETEATVLIPVVRAILDALRSRNTELTASGR